MSSFRNFYKSLKKYSFFPLLRESYIFMGQLGAKCKWAALSRKEFIMLDLGSGAKKGENGWTTVDRFGADINYDLRKDIPLNDDCVSKIYTSHMLEHMPFKAQIRLIKECRRLLKRGGIFSVCVPNARNYIEAYNSGNFFCDQKLLHSPAVINTGSLIDQLNYIAYMDGEHHYLFDIENLINTLKICGFTRVNQREFDPLVDSADRDFESIYAYAIK